MTATGVRERTRRAVRSSIRADALPLFEQQGFRATTIDQIAAAAGVSVRTFFRYFEAKEDVVVGEPAEHVDVLVEGFEQALGARPLWAALRRALDAVLIDAADPLARRTSALILETPELRARHLAKRASWEAALTAVLHRTDGSGASDEVASSAIVGAALACFDAAVARWTVAPGTDLGAALDDAMAAVRRIARA